MKILFVSTVPVFPPTDGVRIPPANYILGLQQSHDVDFLLLDTQRAQPNYESDCEQTRSQVGKFWRVPIRRGSKPLGLVREVLCRGPFYGYWSFDEQIPKELTEQHYDAIFACTPPAIAIFSASSIQDGFAGSPRWVAAISDIHSLVMAQLAQNASKNHRLYKRTVQRLVFGFRSRALAVCEMSMLMRYDHHLVQTEKEVDWVRKKGTPTLSQRTVQISNAVNDQLFELPTQRTKKRIAFVGVLSALYAGRFEWFIHNVWKATDHESLGMSLTAIGRGASEQLQTSMQQNQVEYIDFVEDLKEVYQDHDILIAPIFKGYGLINKVVEAMAAGCIVIGDATAFNGIPGFSAGKHGFVANTQEEFVEVLTNQLEDPDQLNEMREAARHLMEKHFRWQQRIEVIEQQVLD